MKRIALALPALLLLAACGSNEAGPTAAPAPTSASAPNIFAPAAQPSAVKTVEPVESKATTTPAVDEALATLGETPGMSDYLSTLVADGVASTSSELLSIGMYTPSMCQMKAQMGMSDADAAKHVPDDLASNVQLDATQAKALIAAANKYICE